MPLQRWDRFTLVFEPRRGRERRGPLLSNASSMVTFAVAGDVAPRRRRDGPLLLAHVTSCWNGLVRLAGGPRRACEDDRDPFPTPAPQNILRGRSFRVKSNSTDEIFF